MTTVNEIYELIKSHNFHQEMWFDVLSCISEMPTYKRLKDMVNSLLTRGPENLNLQSNDKKFSKGPIMFPELTIMAFTIDGIVIEVLRKKLREEWTDIVNKVIEECKQDMNGNLVSTRMLEDIESIFSAEEGVDVCIPQKKVSHKTLPNQTTTKSSQKELSSKQPVVVLNRIDSRNNNSPLMAAHSSEFDGVFSAAADSDFEKDLSSVHTSDLSSFEDEISISSDDGGEKCRRTVPLKIASELYTQNKLPEIYKSLEKMNELKEKMTPPKKRWKNDFHAGASGSAKNISQRIRKPNSKYFSNSSTYFTSLNLSPTTSNFSRSYRLEESSSSEDDVHMFDKKRVVQRKRSYKALQIPSNGDKKSKNTFSSVINVSPFKKIFKISEKETDEPQHKIEINQREQQISINSSKILIMSPTKSNDTTATNKSHSFVRQKRDLSVHTIKKYSLKFPYKGLNSIRKSRKNFTLPKKEVNKISNLNQLNGQDQHISKDKCNDNMYIQNNTSRTCKLSPKQVFANNSTSSGSKRNKQSLTDKSMAYKNRQRYNISDLYKPRHSVYSIF